MLNDLCQHVVRNFVKFRVILIILIENLNNILTNFLTMFERYLPIPFRQYLHISGILLPINIIDGRLITHHRLILLTRFLFHIIVWLIWLLVVLLLILVVLLVLFILYWETLGHIDLVLLNYYLLGILVRLYLRADVWGHVPHYSLNDVRNAVRLYALLDYVALDVSLKGEELGFCHADVA